MSSVRRAVAADIHRVCRTATLAFVHDPLMRWFYPDDDDYVALAPSAFEYLARRSVAQDCTFTTDDTVAIGIFFPPGRPHIEVEDPPGQRPTNLDLLARFEALGATLAEQTPPEPHWYLNVLATHPDWQRQGLGAAIIAPTGEVCRRDGLALYLETESIENVAYYTHLGFRVRSEWDLPLDGPHLWGMIREP
ncbi:MAG: GNAT family N-acetyltransferase [Ilumatobacteraceae bacterium]